MLTGSGIRDCKNKRFSRDTLSLYLQVQKNAGKICNILLYVDGKWYKNNHFARIIKQEISPTSALCERTVYLSRLCRHIEREKIQKYKFFLRRFKGTTFFFREIIDTTSFILEKKIQENECITLTGNGIRDFKNKRYHGCNQMHLICVAYATPLN